MFTRSLSDQWSYKLVLWPNVENDLAIARTLAKLLTCTFDTLYVSLSASRLLLCSCPQTQEKHAVISFVIWIGNNYLVQRNIQRDQKWCHKRHFAHINVSRLVLCHSDPVCITLTRNTKFSLLLSTEIKLAHFLFFFVLYSSPFPTDAIKTQISFTEIFSKSKKAYKLLFCC